MEYQRLSIFFLVKLLDRRLFQKRTVRNVQVRPKQIILCLKILAEQSFTCDRKKCHGSVQHTRYLHASGSCKPCLVVVVVVVTEYK